MKSSALLLALKAKTRQKIVINHHHLHLTMNLRWVVLVFNIQVGVIVGESLHMELLSLFLGGIAVNPLMKWVRTPLIHRNFCTCNETDPTGSVLDTLGALFILYIMNPYVFPVTFLC